MYILFIMYLFEQLKTTELTQFMYISYIIANNTFEILNFYHHHYILTKIYKKNIESLLINKNALNK